MERTTQAENRKIGNKSRKKNPTFMQICLLIFQCSQFISLQANLTHDCKSKPILKQQLLNHQEFTAVYIIVQNKKDIHAKLFHIKNTKWCWQLRIWKHVFIWCTTKFQSWKADTVAAAQELVYTYKQDERNQNQKSQKQIIKDVLKPWLP